MGTDAETNDVVALAKAPLGIGPLSEDAIRVVNRFYIKVRTDPELGPIFERAIPGDWGPHDHARLLVLDQHGAES